MSISTGLANTLCASGNHKFSVILITYSILKINYLLFGNGKSCLEKVNMFKTTTLSWKWWKEKTISKLWISDKTKFVFYNVI